MGMSPVAWVDVGTVVETQIRTALLDAGCVL
jgi:hypothetical protein